MQLQKNWSESSKQKFVYSLLAELSYELGPLLAWNRLCSHVGQKFD